MTDLQRDVLVTLRVFGPMSNFAVARRLEAPASRTYRALAELVTEGYAVHPKKQAWDISEQGRRWFARRPGKALTLFSGESQGGQA